MDIKKKVKELIAEGYVEGKLAFQPLWYVIWRPEEIDEFNKDFQFSEYAPEFTGFGDSGSNALLAINNSGQVFTIPAIGMHPKYADRIAESIDDLKQHMQKNI